MEYQHKLLLITAILVAAALYIAFTTAPAPAAPDSSEAEELLLNSSGFGKGLADYAYSYTEVSDGYRTTYSLIRKGGAMMAEVQNPLSTKRVYLLGNDTILCIKYPVNETCSSIANDTEMQNYIQFVQSRFFNDTNVDRAKGNIQYLMTRGYLSVGPSVENATVGTIPCRRISYVIDYSNLSLEEAGRFSISSDSPKTFWLSACISEIGLPYETSLEYADKSGMEHNRTVRVSLFRTEQVPSITPPANLSGDAVEVFRKEREQQIKLAGCHTERQGEEREKCVSDLALILKRKDLCDLAGSRRDRCLVALVPLTKDQTICGAIRDASFKDDCYIELAGAYKDSSYCEGVKDQSKLENCQQAASPKNESDLEVDPQKLLNYFENYGKNESEGQNATNGTG
ncbi:MAG: hypothetical protein AB1529_08340 [Candidatus Micrarchaeota archaeon]